LGLSVSKGLREKKGGSAHDLRLCVKETGAQPLPLGRHNADRYGNGKKRKKPGSSLGGGGATVHLGKLSGKQGQTGEARKKAIEKRRRERNSGLGEREDANERGSLNFECNGKGRGKKKVQYWETL